MRLKQVHLRNFRKFSNEKIEFSENLNLIEGENNAGKSSIFYAIYFGLTGNALNFRSPKEYINFDESKMMVDIEFTSAGTDYFIRRHYTQSSGGEYSIGRVENGNRTILESTEKGSKASEVNKKLYDVTGLNKKIIENVTYAAQQKFVNLIEGGKSQKDAMDYIFDFKTIDEVTKQAKKVIKNRETQVERKDDIKERLERRKEELNEQEKQQNQLQEEKDKLKSQIEEIEQNLEETKKNRKDLEERFEQLESAKQVSQKLETKKQILKEKRQNLRDKKDELEEIGKDKEEVNEKIDDKKKKLEEVESQLEDIGEKKESLSRLQQKEKSKETRLEQLREQESSLEQKIEGKKDKLNEKRDEVNSLGQDLSVSSKEQAEKLLKSLQEKEKEIRDNIKNLESDISENKTLLKGAKETYENGECTNCGRKVDEPQKYKQEIEELESVVQDLEEDRDESSEKLSQNLQKQERVKQLTEMIDKVEKIEEEKQDLEEEYVEAVLGEVGSVDLDVVVDTGNGVAGPLAEKLFEALGCEVKVLNREVDGSFPEHLPDPTSEEAKQYLRDRMSDQDLGVVIDGDGDRAGFIVPGYGEVSEDEAIAMISRHLLEGSGTVIHDLRASKLVSEEVEDAGGEPLESRVGHTYISEMIHRRSDVVFAGELSGHFYFPGIGFPWDDGLLAAAVFSSIVEEREIEEVLERADEEGISEDKAEEIIEKLKREGELFEPQQGHIQKI